MMRRFKDFTYSFIIRLLFEEEERTLLTCRCIHTDERERRESNSIMKFQEQTSALHSQESKIWELKNTAKPTLVIPLKEHQITNHPLQPWQT